MKKIDHKTNYKPMRKGSIKEKDTLLSTNQKVKIVEIGGHQYQVIRDVNQCFFLDDVNYLYTDYFESYDYILGDFSYDKLRLKGFCDKTNKICNDINDISMLDSYIANYCSYKANYFLLKKV